MLAPIGGTRILARVQFGLATSALPPHRAFVLGGRGTLLGDQFREWGGRRLALVHVEWRTPVPFLRLAAGPARTPGTITLAPYAAAGWTDDMTPLTPWRVTPGPRDEGRAPESAIRHERARDDAPPIPETGRRAEIGRASCRERV